MTSKRHQPNTKRTTQEDCIVQWEDGTENIVYVTEIENVDTEKPISIGSRIKMLYKKKWYFGYVIEMNKKLEANEQDIEPQNKKTTNKINENIALEGSRVQDTIRELECKAESNDCAVQDTTGETVKKEVETADMRESTPADESSSKQSSSPDDFSTDDDTDNDPDYEQCCEVVGCGDEVWSSCHKCNALMCYKHFLKCEDLECHRGHKSKKPKKINYPKQIIGKINRSSSENANKLLSKCQHQEKNFEDMPKTQEVTDPLELLTIQDINQFTRTVGTQTKPNVTANRSTQTQASDITQQEEFGVMASPTKHTDMMNVDPDLSQETQDKKGKGKKYFCIYCKKLVLNFARHLQISHREEKEIEQLCALPKGSGDRMKLLDEIRGRGTLYFNTSPELNQGDIIVRRRKPTGRIGYTPCPKCKNFYKKPSLHKHFKTCTGLPKAPKNLQTTSLSFFLPSKGGFMDAWLKNEVLPGLSNKDGIRTIIVEDPMLVEYGNYLCVRHRTNRHLTNMVRSKLRQMAKLLKAMRELDDEITTLESGIKPGKYDVFMKAVDMVAGYNPADATYRAPSLVTHIGGSAQECANILQTRAIKNENEDLQTRVVNWLKLYKQEFYYGVGKSALSKVAEKKWNKPRLVPVATDIIKLNNLIKTSIEEAKNSLQKRFDRKAFDDLNRAVMLQIIIFNRKRIGEVEKLLVSDFEKRHNIQKESEIYKTLSANEKIVASRYMRMEVRGKLGRPVSLLISKSQVQLIKMILNLRKKANVSVDNQYVFGRNGALSQKFYSAPPALRWFSQRCGASRPDLLTGTKLRKHMATISQAMDLTENDLSILADFMGHNVTTHRNFYRMPSEVTHLARISQVLMSLEEGDVSKYAGKRLDQINVDVEVDESDEEERGDEVDDPSSISTHQQQSSTTPAHQTDSMDLTSPISEIGLQNTIKEKERKTSDSNDNTTAIQPPVTVKQKTKRVRTPSSAKGQTHSTITDKHTTPIKKGKIVKKTWKTPERHIARNLFAENIRTGRLPSLNDCLFALREYKELSGRTPDQLKAWVYNEINRNTRR